MTETNTPETPTPAASEPADQVLPEVAQSLHENAFDLEFPYVPLSAMQPAKYNPREISDEALEALANSLKSFGLVQPLVWNKRTGNLVGGHQRYKVLLKEGVKEAKTCIVDLDDTEEQMLNITLNNPALQGEFNMKMLSDLVKVLKSKKSAADFKSSGLEALAKQMPLFDGVKETAAADQPKKKLSAEEAKEQKMEKADIKMLQLFYTNMQHKQVMSWVATASAAVGTDNASDTIYKLLEAFNAGLSEEIAAKEAAAEPSEAPAVVESLETPTQA